MKKSQLQIHACLADTKGHESNFSFFPGGCLDLPDGSGIFFSNKILKIVTSVLMHSRELLQGEKNFVAQFYFCLFETTGLFQDIGMQNFLKSDSLTIPWSGHPKAVVKTRKNRFENMKMLWYFQMSTGVELKEWTNDSLVLDLSKLIHSFLVEIPIISEMLCCLISA